MTLSNSQCIEVAEKVWRMNRLEVIKWWTRDMWDWENDPPIAIDLPLMDQIMNDAVNSWQGFGRTLEAMWERGTPLEDIKIKDYKSRPRDLIGATHLAALEALK